MSIMLSMTIYMLCVGMILVKGRVPSTLRIPHWCPECPAGDEPLEWNITLHMANLHEYPRTKYKLRLFVTNTANIGADVPIPGNEEKQTFSYSISNLKEPRSFKAFTIGCVQKPPTSPNTSLPLELSFVEFSVKYMSYQIARNITFSEPCGDSNVQYGFDLVCGIGYVRSINDRGSKRCGSCSFWGWDKAWGKDCDQTCDTCDIGCDVTNGVCKQPTTRRHIIGIPTATTTTTATTTDETTEFSNTTSIERLHPKPTTRRHIIGIPTATTTTTATTTDETTEFSNTTSIERLHPTSGRNAAILGGTIGCLLVLIGVGLGLVAYYRRREAQRRDTGLSAVPASTSRSSTYEQTNVRRTSATSTVILARPSELVHQSLAKQAIPEEETATVAVAKEHVSKKKCNSTAKHSKGNGADHH